MNIEDFLTIEKKDGIATLWIDNKKEKMNVVSPTVIGIFGQIFEQMEKDAEVKAVIFISGRNELLN